MKLVLVVALLAAACDKGDKPPSARDNVIAAWKDAGLAPSTFVTAQVQVGSDCATGMVGGLDVLLCEFPNPTAAQAAEEAGRGWIGLTTGSAQSKGPVLVAIADRKKSDPSGKLINQLMKLAPVEQAK